MARPKLTVGTHGDINCYKTTTGWRAVASFRDYDGVTRQVERNAKTKGAATKALRDHFLARRRAGGEDLSGDSSFEDCAGRWLVETKRRRVGTTCDRYVSRLNRLVPALGQLTLHECTTGAMDRYLQGLLDSGLAPNTVRTYRATLSGILGYAVRMGALPANPVRDVLPIAGGGKQSRALTAAEREDLLAKLDADERAVADDLPDVLRFMLGSGCRIGEVMGLRWFRVDLNEDVIVIGDNLVREKGVGLVLHSPKTEAGFRVLPMPGFVRTMLAVRHPGAGFDLAPVFPNAIGSWRDPNNTSRSIRKFRNDAGYGWFSSHACRHTAITMCDQAGLQAREIAGYHGHARPSFTQNAYMDRRQQSGAVPRAIDAGMRPVRQ